MRITKVALAFFSIGFLAGSFEQAAGLGKIERPRLLSTFRIDPDTAILSSTTGALLVLASLNDGLPPELLPPPLSPRDERLDAVAGLAEAVLEPDVPEPGRVGRVVPVLFAPLAPDDPAAWPAADPDLRRRFGARRLLSEPDHWSMSRVPGPMSVPLPEPYEAAPKADTDRSDHGSRTSAPAQEFIMPFERGRVTSLFNQGRYHPAIDLAGPLGSRVHATTRRQRVIFTGWRNGYGNTVVTRDDSGRMHLYAHLQRIATRVGTMLEQGLMLGTLGSTGRSTGPHVHYEVRTRAGVHINPVTLLFPGRRVGRGFAWNGSRSVTRFAAKDQPRPR